MIVEVGFRECKIEHNSCYEHMQNGSNLLTAAVNFCSQVKQ